MTPPWQNVLCQPPFQSLGFRQNGFATQPFALARLGGWVRPCQKNATITLIGVWSLVLGWMLIEIYLANYLRFVLLDFRDLLVVLFLVFFLDEMDRERRLDLFCFDHVVL